MGFPIVPVVMLHMVNDQKDKHPWPWLITPVEIFEDYLRFLKDQKYTTITFTELYSYLNYGKGIPSKSIDI